MKSMAMYFHWSTAPESVDLPSLTGEYEPATGRQDRIRSIFGLLACIVLLSLAACATGGTMTNHTFSFDALRDSPDIDVLDYQYGADGRVGTRPERERVSLGQTFTSGGLFGAMPPGEFLYVKWRIKNSTQVFEDKVDLRSLLPADIRGLTIHFVIKGAQLYVYVIWPWDGKSWEQEPLKSRFDPVPGGEKRFQGHKQVQIYPDPAK